MMHFDQTVILIIITTGLLGFNAGMIGSFLVLQRKSLLGDTIAHATFPGLTGMFFFTLNKNPWIILFSATFSALLASYIIYKLQQQTKLKQDTILGIILATSFGIGTVFLSKIQTIPEAYQAGLTKYLLGNASTILWIDLYIIGTICLISTLCIWIFLQQYKILLFDPEYAATCSKIPTAIHHTIILLTTVTIVIGLQTVGVILISALLIAPTCAVKLWTHSYEKLLLASACFGMMCTTTGTLISCNFTHVPTGPTIVIIATSLTLLSLIIKSKMQNKILLS